MEKTESYTYFVPEKTIWPIIGSIGLTLLFSGFSSYLNKGVIAPIIMLIGMTMIVVMFFGWFGNMIRESEEGRYSSWESNSFRVGMSWFIFSEVMFFAVLFSVLYYARNFSVPWLLGEGVGESTHEYLWKNYSEHWPTNGPEDWGSSDVHMGWWPLPFINTLILLTSGMTITWAHHAIKANNRIQLIIGLLCTVVLGFIFIYFQATEYQEAYHEGIKLSSGIYGSIFFILTGFHGIHVLLGTIMLSVILLRAMYGHFTPTRHFAFEAAAWYWHFVDVIWLGLFIFVYVL